MSPRLQHGIYQILLACGGQTNDDDVRVPPLDQTRRSDSIHYWEIYVHYHDCRSESVYFQHRFLSVLCTAN